MGQVSHTLLGLAGLLTGVALLAVAVSRNANTSGVISALGSSFSGALGAAEAPVTGSNSFGAATSYTGGPYQ